MSKRTTPESMVKPIVILPVATPPPPPAAAPGPVKYDFGHTRRCPRCGGTQTHLRSVDGRYGWRVCQVAVCRNSWKVLGREI